MAAAQSRSATSELMNFRRELVDRVWQCARVTAEADPEAWRLDGCGAWIRRDQFGDDHAEFGWRIQNVAAGNSNDAANLRAFHWRNRFDVAANKAHCNVRADRTGSPAGEYVSPPRNREL